MDTGSFSSGPYVGSTTDGYIGAASSVTGGWGPIEGFVS